jgi:hypothetical protein
VQSRRMFMMSIAAGVAACWWDLASEKASACFRRKRGYCRSEARFSVQPLDDQEYTFTRTYRFTARITNNEGVTPFKVGELISGSFTYDLRGTNIRPDVPNHGFYSSRRNSLTFQSGDLRFSGVGDILAVVNAFDEVEDFGIVAPDLKLPDGWEMDHTRRSQTYSFLLQNAPTRKVIPRGASIPERVSLSDFVSSREVRFDFFHGVTFPGGKITSRATVYATVESLEEVR